ncbi:MAG: SpoIIE family protein phosphatase [Firmicutes bacterium]|nr:SpoIIE family protein phosphatase [Bacillota bacterium]
MGELLKVSAYGLSTTGKELNLDNMYINGRYVTIGSDTQSTISKVTTEPFQLYGVADSEISSEDIQLGVQSGYTVMDMLQRIQRSMNEIGKIERGLIWDSMIQASRAIRAKRQEVGLDRLGTSFASLFLHGNRGLAVHLGDSRIYVIRGGRMLQITDDHLESADMFRLGILSQAQSEVHKHDSNLTAYMGMDDIYDARDEAFSKYFIFYPGDTFILCSDGISDAIMNDEMERVIRLLKSAPVDQLANMLLKAAAEKSTDDMTLVVLHIDDAPSQGGQMAAHERPRQDTASQTGRVPAQQEAAPAPAPALSQQDFTAQPEPSPNRAPIQPVNRPQRPAPAEKDEDMEDEGPSLFDRVKGLFGGRGREEEEAPRRENAQGGAYPSGPSGAPRRRPASDRASQPMPEDEAYGDDEPSLLDSLLANPKRLALIAGIAVAAIVLLIVIIAVIRGASSSGKTDTTVSSASRTESSNTLLPAESTLPALESSVDITSLLNESSVLAQTETQTESSSASSEESSIAVGPSEVVDYAIEDGDSWFLIIEKFYNSDDIELIYSLCDYNGMAIDDMIYAGLVIKVPPISELP